jgi:disulfide bond formation protein DsbB
MTRKSLIFFGAILTLSLLLSACGEAANQGPSDGPPDQKSGAELYGQTCAVCHGKDAKGMPHLGKDLTASSFVQNQGDQGLLAFIIQGRPANDPENTTGIPMPAKGGNPGLTDEQILDIITYLRSLTE